MISSNFAYPAYHACTDVNVCATPPKPTGSRLVRLSGLGANSPTVYRRAGFGDFVDQCLNQVKTKYPFSDFLSGNDLYTYPKLLTEIT
jgi:hypothetical protein